MNSFECYELSPFPLEGQINLGEKRGLIKIGHSPDGRVILFCNAPFFSASTAEATPLDIADLDACLGFVLDIGIKRTRWLTRGGFYFGEPLTQPQVTKKKVSQQDFDSAFFDKIASTLNQHFQSGDSASAALAIRSNYPLQAYNNSRLLYPNFYNKSYLGLLRILDAITRSWSADEFAVSVAEISPNLNQEIYEKVAQVVAFQARRLGVVEQVFDERHKAKRREKQKLCGRMQLLDKYAQFTFSCFYSAYQYRNEFVHRGMPFPSTVTENFDPAEDSGMSYLNPVEGIHFRTSLSPGGVQPGDVFDAHTVVGNDQKAAAFKDQYFKLLPTCSFSSGLREKP